MLIEQRLEQVEVASVDQGDRDVNAGQGARRRQAGKSGTDNDNARRRTRSSN